MDTWIWVDAAVLNRLNYTYRPNYSSILSKKTYEPDVFAFLPSFVIKWTVCFCLFQKVVSSTMEGSVLSHVGEHVIFIKTFECTEWQGVYFVEK